MPNSVVFIDRLCQGIPQTQKKLDAGWKLPLGMKSNFSNFFGVFEITLILLCTFDVVIDAIPSFMRLLSTVSYVLKLHTKVRHFGLGAFFSFSFSTFVLSYICFGGRAWLCVSASA